MFLPCEEEAIVATEPEEEQTLPLVYPWFSDPAWETRANSTGKCSGEYKVWERVKLLAKEYPKSKTHTHLCLIPNCAYNFVKFLKARNK